MLSSSQHKALPRAVADEGHGDIRYDSEYHQAHEGQHFVVPALHLAPQRRAAPLELPCAVVQVLALVHELLNFLATSNSL